MSKRRIWPFVLISVVLIVCAFFVGVMSVLGWNFTKLNIGKYQNNTYEINENFSNIYMNTDTADILFVPSNNDKCRVLCYEKENLKHSVNVENDTLSISVNDERKWYEYISINFGSPKITVELPKSQYDSLFIEEDTGDVEIPKSFSFKDADITLSTGDVEFLATADAVKIKTSTGNVDVEDTKLGSLSVCVSTGEVDVENVVCADDMYIEVSTGDSEFNNVTCKNFVSKGSAGDIYLEKTVATEKLSINRSTGDVSFERSDAAEISVTTDTGSILGTLLSEKVFIVQSDTGRVTVPKTTSGGKCEVTTDTGRIKIEISR